LPAGGKRGGGRGKRGLRALITQGGKKRGGTRLKKECQRKSSSETNASRREKPERDAHRGRKGEKEKKRRRRKRAILLHGEEKSRKGGRRQAGFRLKEGRKSLMIPMAPAPQRTVQKEREKKGKDIASQY